MRLDSTAARGYIGSVSISAFAAPLLLVTTGILGLPVVAQGPLEFEPKVGVVGSRVTLETRLPPGAQVRFGSHTVALLPEPGGRASFLVPAGAPSSFIEVVRAGRTISRSAVPFVVAGGSLVSTPKLIGLKEVIDVYGYADTRPEGGGKPEEKARPILKLDENSILTIGEMPPPQLGPAVELGDAASAATRGMGMPGFLLTARPPKKKPPPTPPPD